MTYYQDLLAQSPILARCLAIGALLVVAFIANLIVKRVLLRFINRLVGMTRFASGNDDMRRYNVIARLAKAVPALIILTGIKLIPGIPESVIMVVHNVASAFIILTIAMAISAALNVMNAVYMRKPNAHNKPIKGYIQVVKIALFCVATILMIAALVDKSPVILLSGVGAMAAVLMLVFQDTILSLVASIQISSSDMVRVGDWIEMPQLNADGDVIDIALHTVKVQNWDKTITTLPTRRLISDPFKNWRGMTESGGRRIKRALFIDQNSIHFLSPDEVAHLQKFRLIHDYMLKKEDEIAAWNKQLEDQGNDPMNMRRVTNIGTFRAYVESYLRNHPGINQNMTLIVRQLSPGENGLPLEIYAFTNDVRWVAYEGIQADIFDHLYAILPEFGLSAFQNPTGKDFKSFL